MIPVSRLLPHKHEFVYQRKYRQTTTYVGAFSSTAVLTHDITEYRCKRCGKLKKDRVFVHPRQELFEQQMRDMLTNINPLLGEPKE